MRANFQDVVLLAAALASVSVLGAHVPSSHSAPIVDVGYAQYQGALDATTNVTSFLGVRYAAAPVGPLRWRAPVVPLFKAGVQPATTQPNECFQAGLVSPTDSEDCLFLNVYSPGAIGASKGLPVVVWIHGGGYVIGNASAFTGQDLVRESGHGVVAVIIQYRLGVLGFLPGSEVHRNGALNAGLLDQRLAFRWVQDHIAAFGGDPAKVTIWGESAGAGSVLQHVIADGGKTEPPLFRAAMTSSVFAQAQHPFNDQTSETLFSSVAAQANCSGKSDVMGCLRSTDATTLQAITTDFVLASPAVGTSPFVPVIDGSLILERPTEALIKKRVNGDMLLSVTNSFEGALFIIASGGVTNLTQYVASLFAGLDAKQVQQVVDVYAADTRLTTTYDYAVAIMGESTFICPTYFMLDAFGDRGFKGEFAVPFSTHGSDLPYYFPTMTPPPYNNSELLTAFSQSFMSVVAFLDTNHKFTPDIKPQWPSFSKGNTEMVFNKTDAGQPLVETIKTDPVLLQRCSFWHSLSAFTHQ